MSSLFLLTLEHGLLESCWLLGWAGVLGQVQGPTCYFGLVPTYLLTEKLPDKWKYAYWTKMCILNKNVPIEKKNASIDWKCAYWRLIIIWIWNSGSYSFGNFFSFIFLRNTINLWVFSKIAIGRTQ